MIFLRRLSLLSALALATAPLALVGCASDDKAPEAPAAETSDDAEDELKALVIKDADDGKTFSVKQGQNITVSLASNATTGYEWQVVAVSKSLGYPTITYIPAAAGGPVGSGGHTKLVWKTKSPLQVGTHSVKLAYERPFDEASADGVSKKAKTFSFTVKVIAKDEKPGGGEGDLCGGIAGLTCQPGLRCEAEPPPPGAADFPGHCTKPSDKACVKGGCSGQLCVEESSGGGISTCEWREEYACYKTAACERQDSGACGFTQTKELQACVQNGGRKSEGEFCGGIAGFQCKDGLECQLEGNYPDAGGTCVSPTPTGKFCGGIANIQCPEGFECQGKADHPDAGGTCVEKKATGCKRGGCSGQLCVPADSEDVGSTCEFKDEYACYQKAACEPQKGGACGFTPTTELDACLTEAALAGEGEFCGGIAGFQCKDGLECKLEGKFPDAGGTCVKP